MHQKIDKNYLGEALKHFDVDNNQIIDPKEWLNYFESHQDDVWGIAKTLVIDILKDVFPNENHDRLPVLAEAILVNHSQETLGHDKELNLMKLYNYVIRFIAPQKYREYQQSLEDKTQFFLYDGVITRSELDIFTDNNNRLMTADIYYIIISYHIDPDIASQMIDSLIQDTTVYYNPYNFTLDADGVFEALAIEKYGNLIIDIDAFLNYAHESNIMNNSDTMLHLFGIHNDLLKNVHQTGCVDYETAYRFLNFWYKSYLEIGIQSLLNALSIELKNNDDILNLIDLLGYVGKPHKIFREIAGLNDTFTAIQVTEFLDDNQIQYSVKA